jgi:hypothetical protein
MILLLGFARLLHVPESWKAVIDYRRRPTVSVRQPLGCLLVQSKRRRRPGLRAIAVWQKLQLGFGAVPQPCE